MTVWRGSPGHSKPFSLDIVIVLRALQDSCYSRQTQATLRQASPGEAIMLLTAMIETIKEVVIDHDMRRRLFERVSQLLPRDI
jgi:hypothetical protein